MAYDVKRKESGVSRRGGSLPDWVRRGVVHVLWGGVVLGIVVGTGVFAYTRFEPFQKAIDEGWAVIYPFYLTYGIWPTLGMAVGIITVVWACIEEIDQKERRRESMKENG